MTVRQVAGITVALIPVAQDSSPQVSSTGDLVFGDTVETAIAAARQARKDGGRSGGGGRDRHL